MWIGTTAKRIKEVPTGLSPGLLKTKEAPELDRDRVNPANVSQQPISNRKGSEIVLDGKISGKENVEGIANRSGIESGDSKSFKKATGDRCISLSLSHGTSDLKNMLNDSYSTGLGF